MSQEVGSCALTVELQSRERSPILHLCRLICSKQWWISPAGLGQCLGACWCPLQVERRMLQEGGKKREYMRVPDSLLWVISLLEGFLDYQKPLCSWDDLKHPLIL